MTMSEVWSHLFCMLRECLPVLEFVAGAEHEYSASAFSASDLSEGRALDHDVGMIVLVGGLERVGPVRIWY